MLHASRDVLFANIDTALDRPHAALRLLGRYRSGTFAGLAAIPAAKAYLAFGDLHSAQNCIRQVLTGPGTQVDRCTVIDAMLCDAQIAQLLKDQRRALDALVRALEIADGDLILPFARMADVFAPLLAHHPTLAER